MPFFNFFSSIAPKVSAQSDEEEELVDPQVVLKEKCGEKCVNYKNKMDECTTRVNSRSQTQEICAEELYDLMHCIDHCVAKDLFKHLK